MPIILNEDKVELANIINRLLDKNKEEVVFDYLERTCEDIIHERDYRNTVALYERRFKVLLEDYADATHGRFKRDCMREEQFLEMAKALREWTEAYLSVAEKHKDAEDYLARLEQGTRATVEEEKNRNLQSINDMLRRIDP